MPLLVEALDALPKVELHCHVEGTMRPQTVVELAHANRVPLPTADPQELYVYDSLDGFLRVFWLVQSTLATRGDWARLGYESIVDGAAHGLVYREAFVTPARHLAAGQRLADIVAGLDEGLSAAEDEVGVVCRLIVDIDRAFGPEAGAELVEQLAESSASCEEHTERRGALSRAVRVVRPKSGPTRSMGSLRARCIARLSARQGCQEPIEILTNCGYLFH